MRLLRSLAVLAALAAAFPAAADEEIRIAIVDFANRGADDLLVKESNARVNAELHKLGVFKVTSKDDLRAMISHEKEKTLLGCEEASCLAEIGGALGVDYLVTGTVTKIETKHSIDLRLVNIKKATVENVVREEVTGGQAAVIDKAGDAAIALVSKMFASRQGYLVLVCDEPGATVKIDGTEWTSTPVRGRLTLPFGPHVVEVSKKGFLSWRERVSIQPKQAIEREVPLVPSPDFIADYESTNSKYRLGAWISTVVAVGGVGGATFFRVQADSSYGEFQDRKSALEANPADTAVRGEAEGFKADVESFDRLTLISGGVALVSAGLATFFWIAGDDPDKYERYREVAGPGGSTATAGGEPATGPAEARSPVGFDPTRLAFTF